MPPVCLVYRMFGGPKAILKQLTVKAVDKRNQKTSGKERRDHVMAAALALQCVKSSAIRNELSLMQKELAIMISPSNSCVDDFIRTCLIRCLTSIIFDIESPPIMRDILENNVLCCLVDVIHNVSSRSPAFPFVVKDSARLALSVITVDVIGARCADSKHLLFHCLHRQGKIPVISRWALLGQDASTEPGLVSIKRLGITILIALCRIATESPTLSQPWFEAIEHEHLLRELINAIGIERGAAKDQLSLLATDIIELILQRVTVERPVSSSTHTVLESIVKDTRYKVTTEQHNLSDTRDYDECVLYHTIALFACSLILENNKRKKVFQSTARRKSSKQHVKGQHFPLRAEESSTIPSVIAVTWALVHVHKRIGKVATLAFQELFSNIGNCILKSRHIAGLLDLGYIHILMVVRELCRSKGRIKRVSLQLENAISIAISVGEHIGRNDRITDIPPVSSNRLLLEQFFLMHVETRRMSKGHFCLMEECINNKIPWDNCEEIYNLVENIMRMYDLVIVLKNRSIQEVPYTNLDEKTLKTLKGVMEFKEVKIEICSRDKIGPVVLRCPPIDKIISNAPVLAMQVRVRCGFPCKIDITVELTKSSPSYCKIAENCALGSFHDRSIIAQINTSSYDATEEYLCHVEFGTDYTIQSSLAANINHCLDVIKIAYKFGSHRIVDSYLTLCYDMLINAQSSHHFLETAMAVNCENSVLKSIALTIKNILCFKKVFACFISRQTLFTTSIQRVIRSIKKCESVDE